jgi:soluble lytic murein transglycosylase-like protein
MKIKIFLTTLIFNIYLAYPTIICDANIAYMKLKDQYKGLRYEYFVSIYQASVKHKLKMSIICAVIQEESHWDPCAVSKSGALGLMQIMPKHHYKEKNREDLFTSGINIDIGARVFKNYYTQTGFDFHKAIRYYNAGPNSSEQKYEKALRNRTYRNNIKKLVSICENVENKYYKVK